METPIINGVPVVPGTALAAIVAVIPKELAVAIPMPVLSAMAAVPAAALADVIPEIAVASAGDTFEKALLSIASTQAAAQAATATLALNHAIMASAAKLKA